MGRFLLVVLVLLACAVPSRAADELPGEAGLRLQRLGVEDGLSQASARAIAQDGQGMLWIGTQDGLNRFDGYGFKVFRHDPQASDSLSDNHVTALSVDAKGRLWVGTQAGGLGYYDPDRRAFRNFPVGIGRSDALAAVPVNAITPAPDGSIWVASGRGHLQRLDPVAARFTDVRVPGDALVRALLVLPDGDLLIGSSAGAWRHRAGAGGTSRWLQAAGAPAAPDVQALAPARDGHVWMGTATRGVYELDAAGRVLRHWDASTGLAGDDVRALLADADGRVWIGTYTGLSRVDAPGATPRSWGGDERRGDGLASERVHALAQDRDGLVWIGTWLGGVHLYQPASETFREFRADPQDPRGLPGSGVRAIEPDPDGSLWLGVQEGGGLVRFDPARGVLARFHPGASEDHQLPSDRVQAIARSPDGDLWVGFVDAGLARRAAGGTAFERMPLRAGDASGARDGNVLALHVDRGGTLWVGYQDRGLDVLCRGCQTFRHYAFSASSRDGLPGQSIGALFEDASGAMWVGARPGGLARFDRKTGRFTPLRALLAGGADAEPRTVTTMTQSRNGELWVGTQGSGLVRLTPAGQGRYRLTAYTHKQGLAAEAIGSIIEDAVGTLWISTTLGISRLDPRDGRIENFSARSGAQVEGYFVDAGAALAGGRIVFGGLRGLTLFDPAGVTAHDALQRPVITEVRAFQTTSSGAADWRYRSGRAGVDQLWLRAGSGGFGFGFSAAAYADPDLIQYSYRLDPIDRDWIDTDASQRNAGYPHLAPGDYRLRVRARYPGEGHGPERLVDVHLDALWWQSAWARVGLALVVAVPFGFWGWSRRQRSIERTRAQAVLAESEERLTLALWGTGDEFWDADLRTGRVVRVNPLSHIHATYALPDLTFADLLQHVHEDDRNAVVAALDRHVRGAEADFDCAYRLKDLQGDWRWLRSRGRTVERDAKGRPVRMAGVSEDVTEFHEQARRLARINQELEARVDARTVDLTRVNRELTSTIDELRLTQHQLVESEKLAALGGLVAGIAHEVNTPLGVGVTAASHLDQQAKAFVRDVEAGRASPDRLVAFGESVGEASAMVLRNLQRADRMIRSFKQVAVDQASEEARPINVAAYLDEIMVSLQPVLKRSPHQLVVDVPASLNVTTQPGALYQVVANLVTNSLTHAFTGIARGTMRIAARAEGDGWTLAYSDDGIGMAEDVRRHVYDPFFTTRRGQGGSGLGMHIVYNLAVQALGGTIECESAPGQGTRFLLRMPQR